MVFKKLFRCKRRRGTVIKCSCFLLSSFFVYIAITVGVVEIHLSKLITTDGLTVDKNADPIFHDKSVMKNVEDLFELVDKNRAEIVKEIDSKTANYMIELRETELLMAQERHLERKKERHEKRAARRAEKKAKEEEERKAKEEEEAKRKAKRDDGDEDRYEDERDRDDNDNHDNRDNRDNRDDYDEDYYQYNRNDEGTQEYDANREYEESRHDDFDSEAPTDDSAVAYLDSRSIENSTIYIDRRLMVKFLKTEKYLLNKRKHTLKTMKDIVSPAHNLSELPSVWNLYFDKINELGLTSDSDAIEGVLKLLSTRPIASCIEKERGTQVKLIATFDDGNEAMIKPMRKSRDYETPPDHYYFSDFERHTGEISAFHLDRLLKFYRVPPTVGRRLNITKEVKETGPESLAKTFFVSPAGNICFTGHCEYYCDTPNAVCGRPYDQVEGSVQLMLPRKPFIMWFAILSPYRRSYSKRDKAEWEVNDDYCERVVFQNVKYQTKSMLDMIDTAIFDFLIGNMDRHHYEQFQSFGNYTFKMHLDNGRSFGKTKVDEMSILAPLKQCCFIRYSTFQTLKELHEKKLSKLMDESLKKDPLYPILTDGYYKALDRRVVKIFLEVQNCVVKHSVEKTIVDDGY